MTTMTLVKKVLLNGKKPSVLYFAFDRRCYSAKKTVNKQLWEVQYRHDGSEETISEYGKREDVGNQGGLKLSLLLQKDYDFTFRGLKNWWQTHKKDLEAYKQRYISQRVETLGPELAAAHFVVYRGGAVKFYNSPNWIRADKEKRYNLPSKFVPNVAVEAIDAGDTELLYESVVHFELLQRLKWLSFRNNKHIDDFFLDRLAFFKDSLAYLDISGCSNVTERGVMSLHRLRALQFLNIGNLINVKHPQLLCLLLEDVLPNCRVEGVSHLYEDTTDFDSKKDILESSTGM